MEDEAKADSAVQKGDQLSIRAPERVVSSDYPPVDPPRGWAFGRYELLGRLAYGGMAEIYLARESAYGLATRYVVIKRVLPHIANDSEFVGLFMDEARVAMSLTHPHISHIYEFGRIDGSYFLAMEWVNGVALNKIIKRARTCGRRLPLSYAVKIVSAVAEALDYAHAARDEHGESLGIVHRDVTPHNIMLTFDGSVKLLDFGIAMAASRSTDTRTGLVRGKLAYMSPQQCLAKAIDGRSDIFALGVCLYEAVTMRRLYRRDTDFEVCEAILRGPIPSVREVDPELPEELDQIIQRCLAKDPDDRYARAGELQGALARLLAHQEEVVTTRTLSELMQELFPVQYESGPKLHTKTDLLNSLPRVQHGSGARVVVSSAPPGSPLSSPSLRTPDNDADPELPPEDETISNTHTVVTRIPRVMVVALVGALLTAAALGAVAVWSLSQRPGPAVLASLPGGSPPDDLASSQDVVEEPEQAPVEVPAVAERDEKSETEKPADPRKGTVWITSDPAGALVYINSKSTGRATPAQLEGFWPGNYRITLRKKGYDEFRTRIDVEAGGVSQTSANLMTRAEAREFYQRRAELRNERDEEQDDGSEAPTDPDEASGEDTPGADLDLDPSAD